MSAYTEPSVAPSRIRLAQVSAGYLPDARVSTEPTTTTPMMAIRKAHRNTVIETSVIRSTSVPRARAGCGIADADIYLLGDDGREQCWVARETNEVDRDEPGPPRDCLV